MKLLQPLQSQSSSIVIRSVYSYNVEYEFRLIRSILNSYPYVSMDTEFPGVVFHPNDGFKIRHNNSADQYYLLKANVDALKLIQVGLTFTDSNGNLPTFDEDIDSNTRYVWEFNFSGFDPSRDHHASDSIQLLKRQGINFKKNYYQGIDTIKFARLMRSSGLVCNDRVSWVTFHGGYDFGYLVKILTGRVLPDELSMFVVLLRKFFGDKVYDIKHMIRYRDGIYGGLDRIAQTLKVDRAAGKCHQAGSDSLLTGQVFQKVKDVLCDGEVEKYAGVVFGLEVF